MAACDKDSMVAVVRSEVDLLECTEVGRMVSGPVWCSLYSVGLSGPSLLIVLLRRVIFSCGNSCWKNVAIPALEREGL